jgi:hypothetical protein
MPEYTLSNSAAVIDAAISSVVGADNTPTATSQNMVTSGGVKNYVDTKVDALDFRIDGVEANATGNPNIITGLTSNVTSTGGNRVNNITLNLGGYIGRDTSDELSQVDYVLVELWVMQGNHDSVSIRRVTLKTNGVVAAASSKDQSYTNQTLDGTWILHDKLWVPTLGLSQGTFTVSFDTYAWNDDWYIRAKATHFLGAPA